MSGPRGTLGAPGLCSAGGSTHTRRHSATALQCVLVRAKAASLLKPSMASMPLQQNGMGHSPASELGFLP